MKLLKQLEEALENEPSTDEEEVLLTKEQKGELLKCRVLWAGSSEEEGKEEQEGGEEQEEEEEYELMGSSGMLAKVKGKGCAK